MRPINQQLEEIIKNAYELFGNYNIGKTLVLCTACCVTDEEEKELVKTPLKKVSKQLLQGAYYQSARDFSEQELWEMKHFLPRVLELVNNFEFPCLSPEITFTRLDLNETEKWTKEEAELLKDFSLAYFRKCLSIYPLPTNPFPEKISSIIVMFGISYFDLKPILNEWTKMVNVESILHFKNLIFEDIKYEAQEPQKLKNSFSTPEVDKIVIDWLKENDSNWSFLV